MASVLNCPLARLSTAGYLWRMRGATILFVIVLQFLVGLSCHAQRCGFTGGRVPVSPIQELVPEDEIVIPVVVHIVWQQPEENIPDERVFSQIEALNEAFAAEHIPEGLVPNLFQPFITDTGIRFCLATRDPQGNPTTGIERRHTPLTIAPGGTKELHYTALGGLDAWDPDRYLNIWVTRFAGGITGTAAFPEEGPKEEDGVEVHYEFFGKGATPPYDRGITTVHEAGHWLGLIHPWGPDDPTCDEDDGLDDTPLSDVTYQGECPFWLVFSCGTPDMSMNFMYYTDDACMAMFTPQQRDLMWATLNGPRSALKTSEGCAFTPVHADEVERQPLRLWPNPNAGIFWLDAAGGIEIEVYDLAGRLVERLSANGARAAVRHDLPQGIWMVVLRRDGRIVGRQRMSVVR